jgi:penicillin-binding protein 2
VASHGSLGLSDAIMRSCNCYFYQYGNTAGIDNITEACRQFLGLGEKTGIELDVEHPGVLPNPHWLQMNKPQERWSAGFTANTSIGQGFVLATPLQMASVTATVANGGQIIPAAFAQACDGWGRRWFWTMSRSMRADMEAEGFSKQEIELIRKGMWKVVNELSGTASRAD